MLQLWMVGMLTVHYFTAPWCGPCKAFGPRLEKFAAENQIAVIKHNVDEEQGAVQEHGIQSIPTTIWFDRTGGLLDFKAGPLSIEQMTKYLDRG